MPLIPEKTLSMLKKQHYAVFGNSAVKLCHYTKTALKEQGFCYKQKFYGIQSHRCLQMTPAVSCCDQKCVYCWRPTEFTIPKMKEFEMPEEIVEKSIELQRVLLSGFGSLVKQGISSGKKLKEALHPKHAAISLSGEPTLYPKLPELIKVFHSHGISTFLVSNALHPEMLGKLLKEKALPTQLYLSVDSAIPEIHQQLNQPLLEDSWERIQKSLKFLKKFSRTCIRVTLVKGFNDSHEKELAELIEKAKPSFVEIKGYMFVGYSRQRLKQENMPLHSEVMSFAENLKNHLKHYSIADSDKLSRVALLWNNKTPLKIDFKNV